MGFGGPGGSSFNFSTNSMLKKMVDDRRLAERNAASASAERQLSDAESAKENEDRLAAGNSRAATLLTGARGLEDEDEPSVSRRTLLGA